MKTIKYILGYSILFFAATSCSKNPVKCFGGSWIQEVSTELEAWSTAANHYAEEPTEENCASYKSGISAYLNALEGIKECVPVGSLSDFDGSLDEARQELSEIDCQQ